MDPFGIKEVLNFDGKKVAVYRLDRFEEVSVKGVSRLPFTIKILLENVLRNIDNKVVTEEDAITLAKWPSTVGSKEVPFLPARVILQDFTGVPAVADLAAMRSAMKKFGGDPRKVNPIVPADLIIDHSIQVDYYGTTYAFALNLEKEFERNHERYVFLKWAQKVFDNFRVVPPGRGIIHQVNLEYLAKVVQLRDHNGNITAFPDSVLGTDSHTTMIAGIGVLGWGVGGIEAEAVMLGQPYYMLVPEVVGVKLVGELPEGATATDLVLTITELLRKKGVVGKLVEFYGPGVSKLSAPDRATIANMSPEYGATVGFFPVDDVTLEYLRITGRDYELIKLVEWYTKMQGMFRSDGMSDPVYSDVIELDMSTIEPSIAGPKNPEDRIPLYKAKEAFLEALMEYLRIKKSSSTNGGSSIVNVLPSVRVQVGDYETTLSNGSIVIAAITSCTNTSNPSVLIGAGLLAKKAVERGLRVKPYVKTSFAPGSRVVTEYLKSSGLLPYLEALGFHVIGYGCTTCIGNSGPLPNSIAKAITDNDLFTVAILSGNRNFEGRIHPLVRAAYLASPMLVVAYALAGRINIDFAKEPIGYDPNGNPVYLKDIWPSQKEIREMIEKSITPEMFKEKYADVFKGEEKWENLPVPEGELYSWDANSTYIQEPPFFKDMSLEPPELKDIKGAYVLALLGDRITTDHISPAGSISKDSPAGRYLMERGVNPIDFNTYGARRGNHEVMIRGTFANVRLKNLLVPGVEGGWTIHIPSGERMTIYDAAMRYMKENIPLIILAGKQYGAGSSRDWAAKGTYLLGVKAVIAESFERIHRSNLIGMGVLPLQFKDGQSWKSLGLTGFETYNIEGISDGLVPRKELTVIAKKSNGEIVKFNVITRLDTEIEIEYYKHGGIMQYVLRKIINENLKK
ncbi:MAG: aconitate hydratase AcnA [Thermoprotei archaeon]|jgi:aconitate hydratase